MESPPDPTRVAARRKVVLIVFIGMGFLLFCAVGKMFLDWIVNGKHRYNVQVLLCNKSNDRISARFASSDESTKKRVDPGGCEDLGWDWAYDGAGDDVIVKARSGLSVNLAVPAPDVEADVTVNYVDHGSKDPGHRR